MLHQPWKMKTGKLRYQSKHRDSCGRQRSNYCIGHIFDRKKLQKNSPAKKGRQSKSKWRSKVHNISTSLQALEEMRWSDANVPYKVWFSSNNKDNPNRSNEDAPDKKFLRVMVPDLSNYQKTKFVSP
jgi:hypothetical protein